MSLTFRNLKRVKLQHLKFSHYPQFTISQHTVEMPEATKGCVLPTAKSENEIM